MLCNLILYAGWIKNKSCKAASFKILCIPEKLLRLIFLLRYIRRNPIQFWIPDPCIRIPSIVVADHFVLIISNRIPMNSLDPVGQQIVIFFLTRPFQKHHSTFLILTGLRHTEEIPRLVICQQTSRLQIIQNNALQPRLRPDRLNGNLFALFDC